MNDIEKMLHHYFPLHAFNKGQSAQERSQSHPNLKMDKKLAARMDEVDQWTQKTGLDMSKFKSLLKRKKVGPGRDIK